MVTRVEGVSGMSLSTSRASSTSMGRLVTEEKATTRVRQPSSSRMLVGTREAMSMSTSSSAEGDAVAADLLAQDGHAGLEIGRLDVGDESPLEAGDEAVLEGVETLRVAVGRDDDLLLRVVEGVEGVEELLLGLLLLLEELDVVDEEHVDRAVAVLEALDAVVAEGVDEVVGEGLEGHVADLEAGVVAKRVVADGLQEVGLAEADAAVDEERVVLACPESRRRRVRQRGRSGSTVR